MNKRVLVIGGANMDVGGRSHAPLKDRDSNPGVISTSLGGVGRNIAHNLCLLGVDTAMLTVLGDDVFGADIRRNAAQIGLDLSLSETVAGERTSTYLYTLDESGDMAVAISDMDIVGRITPQFLAARMDAVNAFDLVVVDGNLSVVSLEYLAEHCTVPLVCDPVSAIKAVKLETVLGKLYAIKPNRIEAEVLSGVPITDEGSLRRAAETILATGTQQVYISLSEGGVFAMDRGGESIRVPCPVVEVANATGGGDAMTAALSACLLAGCDLRRTAELAICAGALACTAVETIHPAMSWENIGRMQENLS